jgi:trehalose 6-phosphate synthase/phosphatase
MVELTSSGTCKNVSAHFILERNQYDFILAAGDDTSDEDLFAVLPDSAFSIHVGSGLSKAHFYLNSVDEMNTLLENMILNTSGGLSYLSSK